MRFIAVYIVSIFIGLSFHNATAAPVKKHSHNGRVHTHKLPKTGVKHYHKHVHNGRAHIHPYSAKVGFKHSHDNNPRAKAWANAVKHKHAGRPHSHPLPRSGVNHQHKHRHGGRSHIHPLPVTGVKHFHQLNNRQANTKPKVNANIKPRMITGLSIRQQMDAVLGKPIRPKLKQNIVQKRPASVSKPAKKINLRDKKYVALVKNTSNTNQPERTTPIMNPRTINKVLAYGYHRHDGRAHQHNLPATGVNHSHKHAHAGRIHSHTIPASTTAHTHKRFIENKVAQRTIKAAPKQRRTIPKPKKVVRKTRHAKRKVVARAKPQAIKPIPRAQKQTPKQIAEGNRQFSLALRYENGTGVKKNVSQAVNWYLRSAKNGNAKAQFNLASLYENGDGVVRNIPQAMRWYSAAARNGDVNAQVNLGNQYARGVNIPKNINLAAQWYKRAADQGDMRGRANLNYLIEDNNGIIKR